MILCEASRHILSKGKEQLNKAFVLQDLLSFFCPPPQCVLLTISIESD